MSYSTHISIKIRIFFFWKSDMNNFCRRFFNETNKFYGNYKSFSFYVGTKHYFKVLGSNLLLDSLLREKKSICNVKLLLNWKSKINKQFIKKHAIQCAVVIHCVKIVNQFFLLSTMALQWVYPTYFAVVMIESLKCAKYYCEKMALWKKMVHFREPKKSCQFFNVNCRWHQTKYAVFCLA